MKQLQAQLLKRRSEIQDGQANTALQSFTPGERMTSKDGVNHIESWCVAERHAFGLKA